MSELPTWVYICWPLTIGLTMLLCEAVRSVRIGELKAELEIAKQAVDDSTRSLEYGSHLVRTYRAEQESKLNDAIAEAAEMRSKYEALQAAIPELCADYLRRN